MKAFLANFAHKIDCLSIVIGKAGSLFLPLLILTILINVILRYAFNLGLVELEEVQWHLNAIVVMSCLAYTYQANEHVRVDILHNKLSPKAMACIEIIGLIFLFFPYTLMVAWHAWGMAAYSWELKEGSPMPSGLPARYLIKAVMALGISLLALQGIAMLLHSINTLISPTTKDITKEPHYE